VSRLVFIHWNAAEAEERAERLRRLGHEVLARWDVGGARLRDLCVDRPDAFVIDLSRIPSHGSAVATWLRQQKSTHHIPIVFVGGEHGKVARVRKLLPDATYTEWSQVRRALRAALQNPHVNPIVPNTMAGYSGTPLPRKLGIREGSVVALLGAPVGFEKTLGALPEDVRLTQQARGRPDLILLFVKSRAELARRFPAAARALAEKGGLWIVWPKKSSGVASDLGENEVRACGLGAGFVDYKVCAVDATWSGLKFARRAARS
jgi:CheY-like chemotaxis protein